MKSVLVLILVLLGICFVASQELNTVKSEKEDCNWVQAAMDGAIASVATGLRTLRGLIGAHFGAYAGPVPGSAAGMTKLPFCPGYFYSLGKGGFVDINTVQFSLHADLRLKQAFEWLGGGFQSLEAGRNVVRSGLEKSKEKSARKSYLGSGNKHDTEYFEFYDNFLKANVVVPYNYWNNTVTSVMCNNQPD